jgi:aspartyl-tRNA synthetase
LSKNISFVPLLSSDLKDSIQIVSASKGEDVAASHHAKIKELVQHSPVAVRGLVKAKQKPKGVQRAASIKRNEDVEISMTELFVLNAFPSDVTFQEDTNIPIEQRHLQLRQSSQLRNALRFRARATEICREYLAEDHSFTEIETPLLFKSTPEGAREFLVPTRTPGMVYALPQSPQQYKQILMASGIPRYFQVAKCFRDEDQRADRQPEFTQLDLEMSFATGRDVMDVVEGLIRRLWHTMLKEELSATPFTIMPYDDAMAVYGSDKPDTRLGMEVRVRELIDGQSLTKCRYRE